MDPMVAKLVQSRKKSIQALEVEVSKMEALRAGTRNPQVAASLDGVVLVKRQRLEKLRAELVGFLELANSQVEIPGTEAQPPVRRKP